MKQQLLLLQDVYNLGRKGDIVTAKPGYVRNFLLPKEKAVIASKSTLRMRAKLQEERAQQAAVDQKEAEALAKVITGKKVTTTVKVDHLGHLYGSVAAADIVKLLEENGVTIDKRHVMLPKPIRRAGEHTIELVLNEGIPASFTLEVVGEGMPQKPEPTPAEVAKSEEEAPAEEEQE